VLQQQLAAGGAGVGMLSLSADGWCTTPTSSGVDLHINSDKQQESVNTQNLLPLCRGLNSCIAFRAAVFAT
jgi:hypothetical protein